MSVEDDTFDIDLYGDDDAVETEAQPEQNGAASERAEKILNGNHDQSDNTKDAPASTAIEDDATTAESAQDSQLANSMTHSTSTPVQQGTKRKAEDEDDHRSSANAESNDYSQDNRPVDPTATPALKVTELHWWTTEEDVRGICARASAEAELVEITFGEHKINGKSKGEAYLEFSSLQASTAAKREIEAASQTKGENGVKKSPFVVFFTQGGNPFKNDAAGNGGKKGFAGPQTNGVARGGAYNNFNNRGGGFAGRGGFNNNRGGGGFRGGMNGNGGMMQGNLNAQHQQGGWGMNANGGGMNGMGGYVNPMMAGYGGMGMGFGGMNRGGGMMNGNAMGMMGRGGGGFGGMGMGMGAMGMNMGAMGGRGGGGMMGRGGWGGNAGGGFQQNFGGGGGFNAAGGMQGQGQQGNKRAKME